MTTPLHKSLSGQLLVALAFVALISTVGLGLAAYLNERAALEAQVTAQLTSVADLKKEQIMTWLQERQADARLLAVNKLNQEHFTEILSPEVPADRKAEFAAFLSDNLMGLRQSRLGYREITFVDTQGIVIIAADRTLEGQPTIHEVTFEGTLSAPDGTFIQDIHFDPETGLIEMAFGHVIHAIDLDSGEELSEVIGVVIIVVNIQETIYPLIQAWPGMGGTGETLLVRAEGDSTLFLNNLRFDEDAALNLRIPVTSADAQPAHRGSRGAEGVIQTPDYRGVPVLAAYRHIPDIGWGFVAKEDLDEAFAPVNALARRIGLLAAVVLVVAGLVSVAISRRLTRPLAQLVQASRAVAAGNLATEIGVNRKDEIGALADSFRSMVAALDQRQERLRNIYNAANDAIFLIDPEHNHIVETNPKASQMLGYSQAELTGMPVSRIHPNEMELITELWKRTLAEGKGESDALTCLTKTGEIISAEISCSPVQIKERQYILAMVRDVTRRKELEEQLRQSQKMEAIGRLAGGIAHDFNNLLTVITGYSELVLHRYLDDENPMRRELEQIHRAGEQAAGLTRQLLAFSRKQVLQPAVLDLNAIVADIEQMLRRLIGEDVELTTMLKAELGRVKADPGQIEQVILNLAVNARDAMPGGGKLTIETANVRLNKVFMRRHFGGKEAGQYVMLAVSDTGIGMDEETLSHIFEPFFTTKGKDKGTGLGLSTVYGIVNQSGGHILVDSKPGQGTTFKIYLPRLEEPIEVSEEHAGLTPPVQGSETTLLVEDEQQVRTLAREILQMNGYTVLEARHGNEALQICEQYRDPIDLLLTDVVMPGGMTGHELAEQLVSFRPETKVLYMSGYADRAILNYDADSGSDLAFLQKPFTPDALARKVRAVLDG